MINDLNDTLDTDDIFARCKSNLKILITQYNYGEGALTAKEAKRQYIAIRLTALFTGSIHCLREEMKIAQSDSQTIETRLEQFSRFLKNSEDETLSPEDRTYFNQAIQNANQRFNDKILIEAKPIPRGWTEWFTFPLPVLPENIPTQGEMSRREFFAIAAGAGVAGAVNVRGLYDTIMGIVDATTNENVSEQGWHQIKVGSVEYLLSLAVCVGVQQFANDNTKRSPPPVRDMDLLSMGAKLEGLLQSSHIRSGKG